MKPCLAFITMFIALNSFSQSNYIAVDRKSIERLISDSSAQSYYPKLRARLEAYDTTLTLAEYRLIYYGFAFQDDYSPYDDDKSKEMKAAFENKNYKKVIKISSDVLSKNPVLLKAYYYKLLAFSKMENSENLFQQTKNVYSNLLDAIISSGDGITCKTAYRVICVSDEYEVMYRYFQIEKVNGQGLETPCDRIGISPSKYFNNDNIYFDVSECFLSMNKMFKDIK